MFSNIRLLAKPLPDCKPWTGAASWKQYPGWTASLLSEMV